jgi:hypothetical protein
MGPPHTLLQPPCCFSQTLRSTKIWVGILIVDSLSIEQSIFRQSFSLDSIQLTLKTYAREGFSYSDNLGYAIALEIILLIGFCSLSATFVMPLVEDRKRGFKHQVLSTNFICD